MKKQILILAFFTLALLAGNSRVYAQLDQYTTGIPALSCATAAEPLHPIAGVSYTYQMDGSTGAELADQWTWWATKDPSFISGATLNNTGAELNVTPGQLLAATNYNTASGTNNVQITWSPEILAGTEYQGVGSPGTPTFVVGYATGALCADNIQVYEINPVINFTVDIANIDAGGTTLAWDAPTNQCVSDVESATYNTGTKALDMNYGTNTLYFEVVAANFVTDWTPTFTNANGLVSSQTAVVTLHASLNDAQTDAGILGTANWVAGSNTWATGTPFTANNSADVVDGVSLFVKVVISNNQEESLTDNIFSLAVDAIDNTGAGIWDMKEADCGDPTNAAPDQDDVANHTVTPRPTIIHNTVDTNPTPANNVITKTP